MKDYKPEDIEKKWQGAWENEGLYKVEDKVDGKENYYTLVEFSYPSGNLHVGHWYAFAVPDIFARYKRMKGFNVLYPMGFDAFGLPAENAAIKFGGDPKTWTYEQMDKMRDQLRSMGAMFPWGREVVSCSPEYYKWTQWMFKKFYEKGLVYQKESYVNWDPVDKTVIANEQILPDGTAERSGAVVEQKLMKQWFIKITDYADRLVDDLEKLDWPEEIKAAQRSWIGRSEGSELTFKLNTGDDMKVFTTRADTLFGCTYVVFAPEHEMVQEMKDKIENWDEVEKYISETGKKTELDRQQSKEKTGVRLQGVTATNPANGEDVPVWIADYVLAGYGTGAVMAVPAHDERDFEFANKFDLPIRQSIACYINDEKHPTKDVSNVAPRKSVNVLLKNSKGEILVQEWNDYDWITLPGGGIDEGEDSISAAKREVLEETGYSNIEFIEQIPVVVQLAYSAISGEDRLAQIEYLVFNLVSEDQQEVSDKEKERHSYRWVDFEEAKKYLSKDGALILNHIEQKGVFADYGKLINSGEFDGMSSEEARVKITEKVGGDLKKTYRLRDWGMSRQRYWGTPIPVVYDPEGNAHAVPDEHLPWVLPEDVDHTPDGTAPLARSEELKKRTEEIFGEGWTPEVETMDTFVDSTWYFYRYLDNENENEFAAKDRMDAFMPIDLYMGGAEHTTMHLLYSRFWTKALHDLGLVKDDEAFKVRKNRGLILGPDGNKMSKSKGNVINPDEVVDRLGADTVRLYLGFMGPYGVTVNYPWDPNGVVGVRRFLERVWRVKDILGDGNPEDETLLHQTIEGITRDVEKFKFNTAISKMMVLVNAWEKSKSVKESEYKALLQLLAPFAPHMAEELWREVLGESESIHLASWPEFDPEKIKTDSVEMVIQVNGKVRAKLEVAAGLSQDEAMDLAKADEGVQKWLDGEPKKVIHIQDKLLNIVV